MEAASAAASAAPRDEFELSQCLHRNLRGANLRWASERLKEGLMDTMEVPFFEMLHVGVSCPKVRFMSHSD